MDYRMLGSSGCAVSSLCLGTMTFGAETDEPGAHQQIDRFIEAGGNLVDDFHFVHSPGMIHVCNVPSPAATSSLEIGREVIDMLQQRFGLKPQPSAILAN